MIDQEIMRAITILAICVIWIMIAGVAGLIGGNRGDWGAKWFVYSLFIGPLAIVAACSAGKRCHRCDSKISRKADVCMRCGSEQASKRATAAYPRKPAKT